MLLELEHKDKDMIGIWQMVMRVLPNPCPALIKSSTDVGITTEGVCFLASRHHHHTQEGPQIYQGGKTGEDCGVILEHNGMNHEYNLTGGHERVAISLPCPPD